MAGMSDVQYRNFLIGEIQSRYREYATAKAKVEKYTNSKRKQVAREWMRRLSKYEQSLLLAFGELPEVKAGKVNMNAVEFAESLTKQHFHTRRSVSP